jgi:hypothetical protein
MTIKSARRSLPALLAGAVVGLVVSSTGTAINNTTAPPYRVLVEVDITDRAISSQLYVGLNFTSNGVRGFAPVVNLPRGQTAVFVIHNRAMRPRIFTVLGKSTRAIRPGGETLLAILLLERGTFEYESTLTNRTMALKGIFRVV